MSNSIPRLWSLPGFLVAVMLGFGDEPSQRPLATEQERLDVTRSWSDSGGQVVSQVDLGGKKVLHGVQASVGPNNWLKEFAVYNGGVLEQRCQFYPNGRTFREQRREHNGEGQEVIYAPHRDKVVAEHAIVANGVDIGPIKTQEVICQGQIKSEKRWSGRFLVPHLDGFVRKLTLQEYRDGELVSSTPFPVEKAGFAQRAHRRQEVAVEPTRLAHADAELKGHRQWMFVPTIVSA